MNKDPFKEYLKESEPDKVSKGYAWSTAIGLQAVDGLKPSRYLIETAIQNIEGKITIKEAQNLIDSYYEERPAHLSDDERTEEADKVSSRIVQVLSETAFSFSPNEYISIHRKLFRGIYKHAGKIRDHNIKKNGCLTELLFSMVALQNCKQLLNMIFHRKRTLVTRDFQWRKSFITLQSLFRDYGRFISLGRATQERRQFSLSST